MVRKRRKIEVTYERDPEGDAWLVHLAADERAHTYGRTLEEARHNIREVAELWSSLEEDREVDETIEYELIETFDLGSHTREVVAVQEDRKAKAAIEERLAKHTRSAAKALAKLGISRRDAADLLGISHQRVQQLVKG
jgi:predicted RNase H-like HicB family nuclease